MAIGKILFKFPQKGDPIGELIDLGESIGTGKLTFLDLPSHVGIFSNGGIIEALYPTVDISPLNKYDNIKHQVIAIDLPHLEKADVWAKRQVGTPYSFISCAEAEYFALTGKTLNPPQPGTDCSQLVCNYIRVGGLQIFGFEPAALIRPSDLLTELVKIGGVEVEASK